MKWNSHAITLIDCPGHHDFSRQVARSARAVEGALLLIDATRGVQAQTLSSVELAMEAGLDTFIPVINKVDLPSADVDRAREQIEQLVGVDASDALLTSAKQGIGVKESLDAIIQRIPPPQGDVNQPLQALVFDSYFDSYRGVVLFVRVVNGHLRKGDVIAPMSAVAVEAVAAAGAKGRSVGDRKGRRDEQQTFTVDGIGFLQPHQVAYDTLGPGDIGFVTAAIRRIGDVPVGDTVTHAAAAASAALPGYEDARPLVFCGLYPTGASDFGGLRAALDRLQLTDGSVWYEADKSTALGSGFRCGFVGLLHMAVVQERLEKEYGLELISSAPSVSYNFQAEGETTWVHTANPGSVPDGRVAIEEPIARVDVMCQQSHVGAMMDLGLSRRGVIVDHASLGMDRVKMTFDLPLAELVTDFHDALKSRSGGFASMTYEVTQMRQDRLVRLDILVAGNRVDGLSSIVHEDHVQREGRAIVDRLKLSIQRHMFKIQIQAVARGKIVASAHIQPFRKDVTAKCYGGDASRKKKLLKKQAEGKKRMKTVGKVVIPQDAFLAVLKRE